MKAKTKVLPQPPTDLTDAWLRVAGADLPPNKLSQILSAHDSDPRALLAASDSSLRAAGLNIAQLERIREMASKDIGRDVDTMNRLEVKIVTLADSDRYPERLKSISDPPPVLFVRGEIVDDDQYAVAIVGSRKATAYGLSLSAKFGRELAANGICVVSGGAYGIDTEAHKGALQSGRTLAILGSGLDYYYPPSNRPLFDRIVSEGRGALITEYPIGCRPDTWHFPARNRIISGLSIGVLLIETPIQSGAMITAHEALDQGREVMAVPGAIDEGVSAGCHQLIRDGAKLIETVDDILEEIGILKLTSTEKSKSPKKAKAPPRAIGPSTKNLNDIEKSLVAMLTLEPKTLDQLSVGCSLPAREVSSTLTMLELSGHARKIGGQGFVRVL